MRSTRARTENIEGTLDDLQRDGIIGAWLREHRITGDWVITEVGGQRQHRFSTREVEIFTRAAWMTHLRHLFPGDVSVGIFED